MKEISEKLKRNTESSHRMEDDRNESHEEEKGNWRESQTRGNVGWTAENKN